MGIQGVVQYFDKTVTKHNNHSLSLGRGTVCRDQSLKVFGN